MKKESKLSPRDIVTKSFPRNVWGYSPKEVFQFLDLLSKEWEQELKHQDDLEKKIEAQKTEIAHWKSRENELKQLKEEALQEKEKIREQATEQARKYFEEVEAKANEIRESTEKWLADVIQQMENCEAQKRNFTTAFRSALDSHYEILKKEEQTEPLPSKLQDFLRGGVDNTSEKQI